MYYFANLGLEIQYYNNICGRVGLNAEKVWKSSEENIKNDNLIFPHTVHICQTLTFALHLQVDRIGDMKFGGSASNE